MAGLATYQVQAELNKQIRQLEDECAKQCKCIRTLQEKVRKHHEKYAVTLEKQQYVTDYSQSTLQEHVHVKEKVQGAFERWQNVCSRVELIRDRMTQLDGILQNLAKLKSHMQANVMEGVSVVESL